jgi:protoporphyrinogen oxidase
MKKVIIIGAGPAGLAAAYEFLKKKKLKKFSIEIYEQGDQVGGISRTLKYKDYRFDIGGHRFYTKFKEIEHFYLGFLKKDMLKRERLSRIYYGKKFYNYPLNAVNALHNLGIWKTILILLSWLKSQLFPYKKVTTFDQWVSNRFGRKLFLIFFKSYTEKVWGIPTSELSSDWAIQRIQDFSLFKAIINAIFRINFNARTIINKFYYPKYGPGMLYDKMSQQLVQNGVKIFFNLQSIGIEKRGSLITSIKVKNSKNGKTKLVKGDYFISTMPLNTLILYLNPPLTLKKQIKSLRFRHLITVNFIIKANPFPDQWIYIHDPEVKVGRIQNFRNWSPFMIKKGEDNTPISMEYFVFEEDTLWKTSDDNLLNLAKKELIKVGLVKKNDILDGFVCKVKDAYPVYNFSYLEPLEKSKQFVKHFINLQLCGRGGLFKYNNQDHSILTGFYAARNIIYGNNVLDVWRVGDDNKYLEKALNNWQGKGFYPSKVKH